MEVEEGLEEEAEAEWTVGGFAPSGREFYHHSAGEASTDEIASQVQKNSQNEECKRR